MQEMPELPSNNWGEKLPQMFYYAKWFVREFQPFIMVGIAMALAMTVMAVIVRWFTQKDDDEDDDYEYREV